MNLKVELQKKFPKASSTVIDMIADMFVEYLYTKQNEFRNKVQTVPLQAAAYHLDLYYEASKGVPLSWNRLFLDWIAKDVRHGPEVS